jgi:hypothetical protein
MVDRNYLGKICCNGAARLRTNVPKGARIYWQYEDREPSFIDLGDIPNHPIFHETRGELSPDTIYAKNMRVSIQRISGTSRQPWPEPFERLIPSRLCPQITSFTMFENFYNQEGTTLTHPGYNDNFLTFSLGTIRYRYTSDRFEGVREGTVTTDRTVKVSFLGWENDLNAPCVQETNCIFEIKDNKDNAIHQEIEDECPSVWRTACYFDEDDMQEEYYQLEEYQHRSVVVDGLGTTTTDVRWYDCLEVFGIIEEDDRRTLEVDLVRYIYRVTSFTSPIPELNTSVDDSDVDRQTIKNLTSPYGCGYPFWDLTCDAEPPPPPECPDGTAYECTNANGQTCCYDCYGNVIAIID